jgi:hypothetical protein|tara:strand:+ start:5422 stop:5601 length:180 start_codon:yes stop_codon:yes gene_type:complete
MFDAISNNLYEINLQADDDDRIDLDGFMLYQYESALGGVANRFLNIKADPNQYPVGHQC